MKKNFIIQAKVWRWPGDGGWHFVNLDKKVSKKIRDVYTRGFVKVNASIGRTSWDASLLPSKRDASYLLCVKKVVRQKEAIFEGDLLKIHFKIK
jgi:Domain of unknown function (DUF1905)